MYLWCGEVEDVVGALTPFGCGVAQVFHDLLVELRLLLVAEVEERGEEEGQEEGWEVESGVGQVEERTLTWMAMKMGEVKVRTRLNLEPNVSVDEVYEPEGTMRACVHSVDVLVGVHVVKRHASGEGRCTVVISVVIGVHVLL